MIIKDMIVKDNTSIVQALKVLDAIEKKVLFVARANILQASLTDGDIRRWILSKGSLEATVKDVANFNPKYVFEEDIAAAQQMFLNKGIEAIPVVNKNKEIISIIFEDDTVIKNNKTLNLPIIIMAGGIGARLYPYTKILPKPLIPIGEMPIAEHIISQFRDYNCSDFYLIVNHKKNMIKAYFNEIEKDYALTYIDEEKPLGTGGGLSLLKGKLNTTFILSNCDVLINADYHQIYNFHKEENNLITMICSLKNITIPYGVVEVDAKGNIDSMKEKPNISFLTNTGVYIVENRVVDDMIYNQAISFPEIIEQYKNAGEKVGIFPVSEDSWMDMGQLDEMEKMREKLGVSL